LARNLAVAPQSSNDGYPRTSQFGRRASAAVEIFDTSAIRFLDPLGAPLIAPVRLPWLYVKVRSARAIRLAIRPDPKHRRADATLQRRPH